MDNAFKIQTGFEFKTMDAKPPSKNATFSNEKDFYGCLSEFLVRNGKAENISALIKVVIESLPRILPISYVSIFLLKASSKLVLAGESEDRLKHLGINEIRFDHLAEIKKWPVHLSDLKENLPAKFQEHYACRLLCFPVRAENRIASIICFQPDIMPLCEKTKIGMDMAVVQIGLTLERLEKGKKIKDEVLYQIDEMAELEKIILRSERQSCMAEMALGVADGIRNPLTVIGGLVNRISKKMRPDNPLQKDWTILLKQMNRLDRLVKDFEKFAYKREIALETWDIHNVIRQTVKILKTDFIRAHKTRFLLHFQNQPFHVKMDRNLLGAAFTHLLLNAAEAIEGENGEVLITSQKNKDNVIIEIQDNGKGIPPDILGRIYDPFFSTKPGGSGLGLTQARQVISEHDGEILVDSRVGKGTTFTIIFPKPEASLMQL